MFDVMSDMGNLLAILRMSGTMTVGFLEQANFQ